MEIRLFFPLSFKAFWLVCSIFVFTFTLFRWSYVNFAQISMPKHGVVDLLPRRCDVWRSFSTASAVEGAQAVPLHCPFGRLSAAVGLQMCWGVLGLGGERSRFAPSALPCGKDSYSFCEGGRNGPASG